jgi:hypothetical protein
MMDTLTNGNSGIYLLMHLSDTIDIDGKRGSSRSSTSFFLPPSLFFHTVQNKLEFRVIGKNISIS